MAKRRSPELTAAQPKDAERLASLSPGALARDPSWDRVGYVASGNVHLVTSQAGVAGNDVEIVRQPLALDGRSRRRLEEHLMVRFPRTLALVSRAVWRLPPRSRLRLALTCRAVISGWEAANRGDFELALALYDPDVETIFDQKMVEIGFEPVYGGRESRLAVQRRATAEWGEWRFEPKELISVGVDRLLTLGRMKGRGLMSGAAVDTDWGALFTTFDGLVIREQIFLDRRAALEAVGLKQVSAVERTAVRTRGM